MGGYSKDKIEWATELSNQILMQLRGSLERCMEAEEQYIKTMNLMSAKQHLGDLKWMMGEYPFLKFRDLHKVEAIIEEIEASEA